MKVNLTKLNKCVTQDYGLPKFNDEDESECSEEDQVSMKVVRMVKTEEPLVCLLHTEI